MQTIKEISNYIEEELEGAENYAKDAIKYADLDKELADMYFQLAQVEMEHVNALHTSGVRLINNYKNEGRTVPEGMLAIYNHLHEKHIEKANEVKRYLEQYRR